MKRHTNFEKRPNYQNELEKIGFDYWKLPSGPDKLPYYQEGVVYAISEEKAQRICDVSNELHAMCLYMVERMIETGDYPKYFNLDKESIPLIEQSWKRGDKSLYGRFDLGFNEVGALKMFEYNGDTPVSILECSVAQWHYIESLKKLPNGSEYTQDQKAQYNFIDETLMKTWKNMFPAGHTIHFASGAGFRHEDFGNLCYLMDTAVRAGMNPIEIQMQDIGHDKLTNKFVDLNNNEMLDVFKLYPWEWMTEHSFGKHIINSNTRWMEPAWKMLLSNKAMLVKLWEMFPNHPNLLPSFAEKPNHGLFAKKAIHGREGSNIRMCKVENGVTTLDALAPGSHSVPEYDHWGYMYQQWFPVENHGGMTPIIGSWIIGDEACGMSIREDENMVTGNDAFFASHLVVPDEHMDELCWLLK